MTRPLRRLAALVAALIALGPAAPAHPDAQTPRIPRAWDDAAMAALEVPLAEPRLSPVYQPAEYYYRIPERRIYKSYPVYAPDAEPPGYQAWLREQEPASALGEALPADEAAWAAAGALVFEAPSAYDSIVTPADLRSPQWWSRISPPVAADGSLPFVRYVVRRKGRVEVANLSCAMCHTRVLPDRSVVKGAQGNFPFDRAVALAVRTRLSVDAARRLERYAAGPPGLAPVPAIEGMTLEAIAEAHEAIPPGVVSRHRTTLARPVQIPDLVGLRERRYLDHTGLVRHHSIADVMRYAALASGGHDLVRFGPFRPAELLYGDVPDPRLLARFRDADLYALARYLYALQPPPNPHAADPRLARGRRVFEAQGCGECHAPPAYTNNKLLPVRGFAVPDAHRAGDDVMNRVVDLDPAFTLTTLRGTGYHAVPSLRGVWYRGPFGHDGAVATLEEWFAAGRAGRGHAYGLGLSAADREALIAFLRSL